jgi:ATP-dependent DNA ligase
MAAAGKFHCFDRIADAARAGAACNMGLEGLVSKRRDRPYQAGRSKHWVKIRNRQHPAMDRTMMERRLAGIIRVTPQGATE